MGWSSMSLTEVNVSHQMPCSLHSSRLIISDRDVDASLLGPANVSLEIGLDDLMESKQFCLNNYLTLGYI